MYYQATFSYLNGDSKMAKSVVVLDCDLFSEVEACLLGEEGASDVTNIHRTKFKEIVKAEDKRYYYKVTLSDYFTDDKGKEKEMRYDILIAANDIDDANTIMAEYVKQGYAMQIVSISKTKIDRVI